MLDFQKYVTYIKFTAESLKYVQEFYTPVCYCGDISTPTNIMRHIMKRDWLL